MKLDVFEVVPKVKVLICDFLGMSSVVSMLKLEGRLDHLEKKMERMEKQLRYFHRQQMNLERIVRSKNKKSSKSQKSQTQNNSEDLSPAVVLLGQDFETEQVVEDYFGPSVEMIAVSKAAELSNYASKRELLAVIFDRSILGDQEDQARLKKIQKKLPNTRFIGVSNYLTLSLVSSLPGVESFATYLNKPITVEGLDSVFDEKQKAIS